VSPATVKSLPHNLVDITEEG